MCRCPGSSTQSSRSSTSSPRSRPASRARDSLPPRPDRRRSRAWRNIVAAAYPDSTVRWRDIFSVRASSGERTAARARGDLLRLYIARHRIEGSSYPTLASSLLARRSSTQPSGCYSSPGRFRPVCSPGRACSLTWRASTGSGSSTTLVVRPGSSSWSSRRRDDPRDHRRREDHGLLGKGAPGTRDPSRTPSLSAGGRGMAGA